MTRTPVSSTNIASVGYDEGTQVLEVEFKAGGVYQYLGLPPDVYNELIKAASLGKFFQARIRNQFKFQRID